jgi:DNA-binding response OmpR family regulator
VDNASGEAWLRILIAEDDPVSRRLLQRMLNRWGYTVESYADGSDAWQAMQAMDVPPLVLLDWMMPGMDGVQVCRNLRQLTASPPTYIMLLTARGRSEDIVAGLCAGADDYITKPFNHEELRARVQVGVRVVELQRALAARVQELESALSRVKQLSGLLPICAYCKKIRNDQNYWQQVESYLAEHAAAQFTHGICPDCYEHTVRPELDKFRRARSSPHQRP